MACLISDYSDDVQTSLRLLLADKSNLSILSFGNNAESIHLVTGSVIDSELWKALCQSSLSIGEDTCYLLRLSFYESEVTDDIEKEFNNDIYMRSSYKHPFLWKIFCDKPSQFYDANSQEEIDRTLGLEYVLFSSNGKWGIIKPLGLGSFLVGTHEFVSQLKRKIKDLETQVIDYLSYLVEENGQMLDIKGLQLMLVSLYGEDKAHTLIEDAINS